MSQFIIQNHKATRVANHNKRLGRFIHLGQSPVNVDALQQRRPVLARMEQPLASFLLVLVTPCHKKAPRGTNVESLARHKTCPYAISLL